MVLPGITLTSSPTRRRLVKCLQAQVWRDNRWTAEGAVSCSPWHLTKTRGREAAGASATCMAQAPVGLDQNPSAHTHPSLVELVMARPATPCSSFPAAGAGRNLTARRTASYPIAPKGVGRLRQPPQRASWQRPIEALSRAPGHPPLSPTLIFFWIWTYYNSAHFNYIKRIKCASAASHSDYN